MRRIASSPRHRLLPTLTAAGCLALLATPVVAAAWGPGWRELDLPAPASSYAIAYVPASLPSGPAPVIVLLHGSGVYPEVWKPILAPLAEELGVVMLLPASAELVGWGVGPDDLIVEEALRQVREGVDVDPARLGLAGHSSGAAYAIVYAYSTRSPFVAVFAMSSPYRTVVKLADPTQPPPLHFYYGSNDPNYQAGYYALLDQMVSRLGVATSADLQPGYGHSNWPDSTLRDGLRFLVEQPLPACVPGPTALCLRGGRFRVEASWETATAAGAGQAVELTDESGSFWFFSPGNVELDVKVLDGCAVNGRFWVFAAGLTDVGVTLAVTDTASGGRAEYRHPRGSAFAAVQDTAALPGCP